VSAYVPSELRRQVRARYLDHCAYCRTAENLTVATFEIEHIIPLAAGGTTILENLCLSCPTCNRCKANRTEAIDAVINSPVSLFHPHRDAWSDHFAWNNQGTEIVGLSPTGRATITALRMNRPQLVRLRRMWVALNEHPPADE
jgi:hypothetical protein